MAWKSLQVLLLVLTVNLLLILMFNSSWVGVTVEYCAKCTASPQPKPVAMAFGDQPSSVQMSQNQKSSKTASRQALPGDKVSQTKSMPDLVSLDKLSQNKMSLNKETPTTTARTNVTQPSDKVTSDKVTQSSNELTRFKALMTDRKELMTRECEKLKRRGSAVLLSSNYQNVIVMKEKDIVWCPVFKASSSTWLHYLFDISTGLSEESERLSFDLRSCHSSSLRAKAILKCRVEFGRK